MKLIHDQSRGIKWLMSRIMPKLPSVVRWEEYGMLYTINLEMSNRSYNKYSPRILEATTSDE